MTDHLAPDRSAVALLVDHVLPLLPPYEFTVYLLLLRLSADDGTVRVGKRTLGTLLGKGTRSSGGSLRHIDDKLKALAEQGYLRIGDANRMGTLLVVVTPEEVPAVAERLAAQGGAPVSVNAYTDPESRRLIFERDAWRCRYCGELLAELTATLDHRIPRTRGGADEASNLVAACLSCNSIKSGKTYEEAAPELLARIARQRSA